MGYWEEKGAGRREETTDHRLQTEGKKDKGIRKTDLEIENKKTEIKETLI